LFEEFHLLELYLPSDLILIGGNTKAFIQHVLKLDMQIQSPYLQEDNQDIFNLTSKHKEFNGMMFYQAR